MREKRPPTHILKIEVPLDMAAECDFDPFQDALKTVLALSRARYLEAICDDPQVSVEEC